MASESSPYPFEVAPKKLKMIFPAFTSRMTAGKNMVKTRKHKVEIPEKNEGNGRKMLMQTHIFFPFRPVTCVTVGQMHTGYIACYSRKPIVPGSSLIVVTFVFFFTSDLQNIYFFLLGSNTAVTVWEQTT